LIALATGRPNSTRQCDAIRFTIELGLPVATPIKNTSLTIEPNELENLTLASLSNPVYYLRGKPRACSRGGLPEIS